MSKSKSSSRLSPIEPPAVAAAIELGFLRPPPDHEEHVALMGSVPEKKQENRSMMLAGATAHSLAAAMAFSHRNKTFFDRQLLTLFQPQPPSSPLQPPHPPPAEANPRDQGLPPHGPPQGRPRRPRQEGRRGRDQVQGPLLAPPLHARRRRRGEGEQAEAVAAPGARRAGQPLKGQENDIKTAQYF